MSVCVCVCVCVCLFVTFFITFVSRSMLYFILLVGEQAVLFVCGSYVTEIERESDHIMISSPKRKNGFISQVCATYVVSDRYSCE